MQERLSRDKSESKWHFSTSTIPTDKTNIRQQLKLNECVNSSCKWYRTQAWRWRRVPRRLLILGSFVLVLVFLLWSTYRTTSLFSDNVGGLEVQVGKADGRVGISARAKLLPPGERMPRRLQCIAWRATSECTPGGPLEPESDKDCNAAITGGMSGYCEVEDLDSGERFQVMRKHCNGLKGHVEFRCSDAAGFVNYAVGGVQVVNNWIASNVSLSSNGASPRDGIAMVVYPRLVASAYATVRVLRDVLNCSLPIEIWFHVDELGDFHGLFASLQQLAISAGGISFHPIRSSQAKGFYSKIHAIHNSLFDRVLFLDADNAPVRDPTFLFESPEFMTTGAIFWPDFWHPSRTLFNIFETAMLWELLDTPFVDMFEQESGQVLVDRVRHSAALELVNFYAFREPNYLRKLDIFYGDKDLFRFAWMKLNASFHMIQSPPASAGQMINGSFCGMTMVQHDADGEVLFLHRNMNKLTGTRDGRFEADGYPDPVIWSHLLSFNSTFDLKNYAIEDYWAGGQLCFGHRDVGYSGVFYLQDFARLSFAGIETDLRRFAKEAIDLRDDK